MTPPMRSMVFALVASAGALSRTASADDVKQQCIQANADAQTLRRESRLVAARHKLLFCAASRCPRLVRDDCAQRLDEVDRAQPTVIFDAHDRSGNDISVARVTLDGVELVDKIDGTASPVDPGEHTFIFEVPGQPDVTQRVVVKEEEKARHLTFVIGAAPKTAPLAEAPPPPVDRPNASTGAAQRAVAWVATSVGVAGLATGGVFGILASRAKSDYLRHCGSAIGAPAGQCDDTGLQGHDDAARKALVSTISFIVGGVAGAAAIVFFATAPHGRASPVVGFGPGEVFVRGEF